MARAEAGEVPVSGVHNGARVLRLTCHGRGLEALDRRGGRVDVALELRLGRERVSFSHLSRELRDLRVSVVNSEFPLISWDERSSLVGFSKSGPFPCDMFIAQLTKVK